MGTIVMVYCAKPQPGPPDPSTGNYPVDTSTIRAQHSATSNGDGTYKSKGGMGAENPSASEQEAFGDFMNPANWPPGYICYKVCYERF